MFVFPAGHLDHTLDQAIEELKSRIRTSDCVDHQLIFKAIEFGRKAHEGQLRKSGEPYFIHPVRVAILVSQYDMNNVTIIGALLHDVIEDTSHTHSTVEEKFGPAIAKLVNALTKVKASKNLTLFRIFELGSVDFRVFVIKLLDRIDNLSDMSALHRSKIRRICLETLNIYVEVAGGLGLAEVAETLKDLVFQHLYPLHYKKIKAQLAQFSQDRQEAIAKITSRIQLVLNPSIVVKVEPCLLKAQDFLYTKDEVTKVLDSVQVVVSDPLHCYIALGEVHMKLRSIPLTMRDYISNPKANGWRGLSSKILIEGEQVWVHFITSEHYRKNRLGIIAMINDGIYQSSSYQQFLQLYMDVASDNVRVDDVFRFNKNKMIQVFTPKGDVMEMRYGSTVLDFAFMVHSQVGLKATGALIDDIRYPRHKILEDGMVIYVATSEHIQADKTWLDQVVMPKARKEILKYISKHNSK